jgi:hydrogenase expression/formation protein HypC
MCLAVPAKLISKRDDLGLVELGGVEREVSLMLTPEAEVGQYLIVHAGFAINVMDEEEAGTTLALLNELAEAAQEP